MSEQLDIVKLIEENPIIKLTNIYQSKLINKIKNKFNTEELKLFVASFYCYLHYKKEDFAIDFNGIWRWLGFSTKQKAKELLFKYFIIEIDYKIELINMNEDKTIFNLLGENKLREETRGRKTDIVLITINTFKRFCMKANTKKAVQIHEYFINLEETLYETLDEESSELRLQLDNKQQQLLDKQYQLEQKQLELEQEKKNKNWLLNRRYNSFKLGDTIYLYKDYKDDTGKEFIYKIGKTKNISERENEYSNTSKSGKIVYIQNCLNCDLTEKVLHHTLDKYRTIRNQEWFNFTEDLAIQTIKSVIYIMDNKMETIETFIPKLYTLLEIPVENKIKVREQVNNIVENNEIKIKNPMNFDLFIEECCEIIEGINTPRTNIKDAHRIWSKNSTKEIISALTIYLNNKFKSTTVIDENGVKRNMFKDVKLKSLIYNVSEKNLDYEQFIIDQIKEENIKIDWRCRISYVDFFNFFIEWKRKQEPHYKLKHSYKKEIQVYLEQKFAGGRVYVSTDAKALHLFGMHGVGHVSTKFGYKEPARTNKRVGQYTIEDILIKKWDSLSIASRELNMTISKISNYARFKTIMNGIYYKYEL